MHEIQAARGAEPLKATIEPADATCPAVPEPDPEVWSPFAAMQPAERRASQRYPAVAGRAWLGWHEAGVFRQTAAWILNVGASGCLVAADSPVPDDRSSWLRPDDPGVRDWAKVRVVGHRRSNAGHLAFRLVFRGACPYDLMKAVAFGPSGKGPARPEPSRSWLSNSW
jgi:hypothetical protein